jgi:hypothetical protein
MQSKEVEIIFEPSGKVTIDQVGWQGKECEKAVDDLIRILGTEKEVSKKPEHAIPQKVKIRE